MGVKAPPKSGYLARPTIVAYQRVGSVWVAAVAATILTITVASLYATGGFVTDLLEDSVDPPDSLVTFLIFAGAIALNILLVVPYMRAAAAAASRTVVADK